MKKITQRFIALAVPAALLLTSAMPVFAVGNPGTAITPDENEKYTITLSYLDNYSFEGTERFGAYQIFSGDVATPEEDYTNPGTENTPIPLSKIQWGNAFGDVAADGQAAIDKAIVGFVFALANASTGDYSYAFSDFHGFEGFVEDGYLASNYVTDGAQINVANVGEAGNHDKVKFDALAAAVADVLTTKINVHEWLQDFTDILGGYAQEDGFVSRYYEGQAAAEQKTCEIQVPAGYYMVKEISELGSDAASHAYSARMLFVANDVSQVLKVDVPQLDKTILNGTEEKETDTAGVGDEVTFQLTGSLPSNYDNYTLGYQYSFEDILSKGLTLKENEDGSYVKVTAKGAMVGNTWNADKEITIATTSIKTAGEHTTHDGVSAAYTEVYDDESNTLTVTFPCLREIQVTDEDGTCTLGVSGEQFSQIYVTYTAVVNENAIVSPASAEAKNGNTNTATLTYSSNPQNYDDTEKTVEDEATVYTFGLEMKKVDASSNALAGAKFALVRPGATATQWEIAKFQAVTAGSEEKIPQSFKENGYNTITAWEVITYDSDAPVTGDAFDAKWLDIDKYQNGADYSITSPESGLLNVSGLDAELEYTMVEIAAPEKFVKIDPFTFTLSAAQDKEEYTGLLAQSTVSNTVVDGEAFSIDKFVQLVDPTAADADGTENIMVANFKMTDLPSTGGAGTILFYILGGAGVIVSIVLFRLAKKKKSV